MLAIIISSEDPTEESSIFNSLITRSRPSTAPSEDPSSVTYSHPSETPSSEPNKLVIMISFKGAKLRAQLGYKDPNTV